MGWDFTSGATKADIIRAVTKTRESETAVWDTLAKCCRGNNLWTVQRSTVKATGEENRFIVLYRLGAEKDYGWGYKDIEESMGPCETGCPVAYYDLAPNPTEKYAIAWRERNRLDMERRGQKLAVGQTVKLKDGYKPNEVTIVTLKPLRGKDGYNMYRLSRRMLA